MNECSEEHGPSKIYFAVVTFNYYFIKTNLDKYFFLSEKLLKTV